MAVVEAKEVPDEPYEGNTLILMNPFSTATYFHVYFCLLFVDIVQLQKLMSVIKMIQTLADNLLIAIDLS